MTDQPRSDAGAFTRDRFTLLAYGMAIGLGFGISALGPAMPLLRDDLAISRTVGGLHFTAIAVGSITAGLLAERFTGAWGRKRVFWWGGAGVAAGSLLIGAAPHPAASLSGGLLLGTSVAAALTVSQAALSDHHGSHRAVALTEVNTALSVGFVVPPLLIGASVAAGAGWRPAFVAPLAVWITLGLLRRSERFPPTTGVAGNGARRRLPVGYWFLWGALIPAVAAEWTVGAWGAGYLVDVAGTTEGSASLLMTAFFGAIAAGRFLGGRIAHRVAAFPLLLGAASVGLGGSLLFWGSSSVLPVVGGLLIVGLGIAMLFPMLVTLAIERATDRSDVAAARVFIAAGAATLVAPLTLGAIADQADIRAAFAMVPGLFVLVVLLALGGRRKENAELSTTSR